MKRKIMVEAWTPDDVDVLAKNSPVTHIVCSLPAPLESRTGYWRDRHKTYRYAMRTVTHSKTIVMRTHMLPSYSSRVDELTLMQPRWFRRLGRMVDRRRFMHSRFAENIMDVEVTGGPDAGGSHARGLDKYDSEMVNLAMDMGDRLSEYGMPSALIDSRNEDVFRQDRSARRMGFQAIAQAYWARRIPLVHRMDIVQLEVGGRYETWDSTWKAIRDNRSRSFYIRPHKTEQVAKKWKVTA